MIGRAIAPADQGASSTLRVSDAEVPGPRARFHSGAIARRA